MDNNDKVKPIIPKFQALVLEISGPVLYLNPSLPQVFQKILRNYWNESTLDEKNLPPLTISRVRKSINAAEKWVILRNYKKGRLMSPFEQERYRKIFFSVLGLKKSKKQEFLDQIILQKLNQHLSYQIQPGINKFLQWIHDTFKIPIFLIDDWEREFTLSILKRKELLFPFCRIITSDQIDIAKPHPRFFETLFKSVEPRLRPSKVLYVTDNPHEIPFVKNLGMRLYYLDLPAERGFHVFETPKYLQFPKPLVPVGKDLQDLVDFIKETFLQSKIKQQQTKYGPKLAKSSPIEKRTKRTRRNRYKQSK